MEKRYQVFVSSTYRDLEEERQEVMHALLEQGCIPSGMELFPAADESQWELIKRVIDDCDYYVLILGGRYGSIGPDGIGYTEMEYDYAKGIGKPIVAFLHKDPGAIPASKSETTDEGRAKLDRFRKKVESKLCKYWNNASELGGVVSRSLINLIKTRPAVGWVRASEVPDRGTANEILTLRRRIDELQAVLSEAQTLSPKSSESLAQGEDYYIIKFSFSARSEFEFPTQRCHRKFRCTWNDIFARVAPSMLHQASEFDINTALNSLAKDVTIEDLQQEEDLEDCELYDFSIDNNDFQTIMLQLRTLGLVIHHGNAKKSKDTRRYWSLTPYGDQVMTHLRAIRRGPTSQ
ncbi:MAG: DUF4062 domain-containing protein [Armatimonadetes bacterium]|nr:DUF4062 domain-containing protein [Armatimonadota bacterium]